MRNKRSGSFSRRNIASTELPIRVALSLSLFFFVPDFRGHGIRTSIVSAKRSLQHPTEALPRGIIKFFEPELDRLHVATHLKRPRETIPEGEDGGVV